MMALDRSPELCNVISNAKHIKTIFQTKIQNAYAYGPNTLTKFQLLKATRGP